MSAQAPTPSAVTAIAGKRGILLVNVGTPDAPTPQAVRRYLAQFLSDPHVVDLPQPARWLLLHCIILPFRPRKSAHAYQSIWTAAGAPLLVHSLAQRGALAQRLPEAEVALGMRYGSPSISEALDSLRAAGADHVTLVPMYPQYALATAGTTQEAFAALMNGANASVLPPFFANEGFIRACAEQLVATLKGFDAQHVLFSYHGLPVRQVRRACASECGATSATQGRHTACPALQPANANCYRAQCYATSRAIAQAADLKTHSTAFQSRLKGAAWIGPFTDDAVVMLARGGVRRLAVMCPSFVADCLETLEEIGQRASRAFEKAGGQTLRLVPQVNDNPTFIDALASMIRHEWNAGK